MVKPHEKIRGILLPNRPRHADSMLDSRHIGNVPGTIAGGWPG
jgi:hypothetical protein